MCKITEIDYDSKKVSLSIRALLPEEPIEEDSEKEDPSESIQTEDIPEGVSVESVE